MPKINQEEYEVLKELDNRWKWIARNYNGALITYTDKPTKNPNLYWDSFGERMDDRLFQFIQWEDSEPYNIAELIREYEWAQLNEKYPPVKEIEETEVKSKRELIEKWESAIEAAEFYGKGKEERLISYMKDFVDDLNQLDEPEVLSQEWIDEHKYPDTEYPDEYSVWEISLQKLLVPNQEKVKIESVWAEDIEDAKASGMTLFKAMNWMAIDSDEKEKQDLFARAWLDGYTVEEQKYYAKVKGWGANGNDGHAYYSGKFPLSLTMATESVAHIKDEWKNYGVYEDNADFVLVEELEE